jgi:hypothetical protein
MWTIFSIFFLCQTTINLNQIKPETDLRYFDYIDITYREEWWADSDRLAADFPRYQEKENITPTAREKQQEIILQKRIDYLNNNFPDEYQIDKTKTTYKNKDLERNREYTDQKQKIIIHHSAMPTNHITNQQQMFSHLQEIYELHCFFRDRGDIGYHFFIDKRWNIYEWKAGWPWIIWAHAQFNNFNSIWINLLWNLNHEDLTDPQLKSLITLSISLIKKYNINIYEPTIYHEKIEFSPYLKDKYENPIWYHKLVSNTACPWANWLDKIEFTQNFIQEYLHFFPENENHTQNINQLRSGISYNFSQPELAEYFQNSITNKTITQNIPTTPFHHPEQSKEFTNLYKAYPMTFDQYKFQLILPIETIARQTQIKTIQPILNQLLTKNITDDQRYNFIYNLNDFLQASYEFKHNKNVNTTNNFRLHYQKLKKTNQQLN